MEKIIFKNRFLFRYWDELHGMCEVTSIETHPDDDSKWIYYKNSKNIILNSQNFNNLMQCTGMKDTSGRLLFEGDIVLFDNSKITNNTYFKIYEIAWNEDLTLSSFPEWLFWNKRSYTPIYDGEIKYLGHIYDGIDHFANFEK